MFVFVGANQSRIPFEFANAMQELGEKAHYIKINGNGNNALDFHIAYYIGEFARQNPDDFYYIISGDRGYDPLVSHLNSKHIKTKRVKKLSHIPLLRPPSPISGDKKIDAIVKNLSSREHSRPANLKTLTKTIDSLFSEKLNEQHLKQLVDKLKSLDYIVVKEQEVSYQLPEIYPPD